MNDENPCSRIAKNWDKDVKFCEPEREPDIMIEIVSTNLQVRLGNAVIEEVDESNNEKENKQIVRIPRMRINADEEEEKFRRKKLFKTLRHHTERLLVNLWRPKFNTSNIEIFEIIFLLCIIKRAVKLQPQNSIFAVFWSISQ